MDVNTKRKLAIPILLAALCGSTGLSSCSDDYVYDDKQPGADKLGESIYDYLKSRPDFTYAVRLIEDLDYADVLSKTGSKTLFPANDEAYKRFFANNPFGASGYDDLTPAQKRMIMNASMINMAYVTDMLPNIANSSGADGGGRGLALRRVTAGSYLDSIARIDKSALIDTKYWARFKEKPLLLWQKAPMMVHFTPEFMSTSGMTDTDFDFIYKSSFSSTAGDIYVDNVKVAEKNVICKNGYIHIMDEVLVPSSTMAEVIDMQSDTRIFKDIMDKFCAPYYDEGTDKAIKDYYNGSTPLRPVIGGIGENDSIFTKRYFNEITASTGPLGENLSRYGLLYYDPNDSFYSSSSSEQDMGVMFVPSDRAMQEYFNGPEGAYLKASYGSWDNVPTDILAMFVKNHQKRSFISSLPHLWSTLTDETSYPVHITGGDVERVVPANNGVVFVINKVLPPIDYKGVYASTLTADNTQVMKWAVTDDWTDLGDSQAMRFYMYLRSMENMYNLLVPTDEAFSNYREPISWALGGTSREIWDFYYSSDYSSVVADVYAADENGMKTGEIKRTVRTKDVIRNRLQDILDMHIVVGMNDNGSLSGYVNDGSSSFFLTKGGATIKVKGQGNAVSFNGGGDIELALPDAGIVTSAGQPSIYDSQNGRTFFIDHLLHDPVKNVYNVLSQYPEFKTFFDLCRGDDSVSSILENDDEFEDIFSTKITSSSSAVGTVVSSFNNFRYTVFVPTNEALEKAFKEDPQLYTWEEIALDSNFETKRAKALYLLKFLRYHFVDNSAYVTGKGYGPLNYETGARNAYDKFHKVAILSDGSSLSVTDENGGTARVLTSGGLFNIMARDLIVNNSDSKAATMITSSSRAVIHQIDRVLKYKD